MDARIRAWSTLSLFVLLIACAPGQRPGPTRAAGVDIGVNDNRTPAGRLHENTLSLRLDIAEGLWQPEHALSEDRVLAFGETGGPLSTPGPLIRVRQGTTVEVTLHNAFGHDILVHGLSTRGAGEPQPLRVPAHGRAKAHFEATLAGTYYYWGTLGDPLEKREGIDSQLTGALIVDPPGGPVGDDRIFVIGRLGAADVGVHIGDELGAWVINGRSWPETERLTYAVGEQVSWRWINATGEGHPMHLHGTYFRVRSMGDNLHDTARPDAEQYLAVTQVLESGGTMMMSWSPERPGNWLFHCHIVFHVMPENRLPEPLYYDDYAKLPHDQHMAGLVLGIHATPADPGAVEPVGETPRRMTLRVGERAGAPYAIPGVSSPRLGYALDGGPVTAPGPVISLERDRPVEIAIVNGIAHTTSVHWHGVELESYYDGVPHWGGDAHARTPAIEPGGSFVARFTPPRAGTFIYHTHFNDYVQLSAGLYGALIVTEPGQPLFTDVDHVFVLSLDGLDDEKDPLVMNGAVELPPMTLRAGVVHRVRLVGITVAQSVRVRLTRGETLAAWRPRAKDGADLPEALRIARPAEVEVYPGETYDFEIAADSPEILRLQAALRDAPERSASVALAIAP